MAEVNEKISAKLMVAIVAAGLMSFCGVVGETAVNIAFPTLMKEFNVSTDTVQWMTTINLLLVSIVVPLSAILKRRFKMKSVFIVANLLFLLGLLVDSFSPDFSFLVLGRAIQGIGTGLSLPLMFNIILEQVPNDKKGMMMGFGALITAIAPAVGPLFGGALVSTIGWRFIFILLIPIIIISFFMGVNTIQQVSPTQKINFDFLSFLMIIITFAGLVYGFSQMGNGSIMSSSVIGPIVIGIIAIIFLIIRSNHVKNPIINLKALTNFGFSSHVFGIFAIQFSTLGLSFILPNYVQVVNDKSAFLAGIIMLPGAALGACMAPFAGRLLDKFGPKMPILTGSGFIIISNLLFFLLGKQLSDGIMLVIYILYMIGMGMMFSNLMTNGINALDKKLSADGNAINNTVQQLAGAIGTSVIAAVVAASQNGGGGNQAALTAIGSQHAFLLLLIFMIIQAIVLSISLFRK